MSLDSREDGFSVLSTSKTDLSVLTVEDYFSDSNDNMSTTSKLSLPPHYDQRPDSAPPAANSDDEDDNKICENIVREDSVQFEDEYTLSGQYLGSGITGEVVVCTHNKTGIEYAVKIVPCNNMSEDDLERFYEEINIMGNLRHPNIIQMQEVFQTDDKIYIVMELCYGGELFDRILEQKVFTETQARSIVRKLFAAMAYVHEKGIVHRDLKVRIGCCCCCFVIYSLYIYFCFFLF